MKNTSIPTSATTLPELLAMGAKITFRSGRSMTGQSDEGYIAIANEFSSLGLWDLDAKSGVDDAVADLIRDAAESDMDLHGNETPQDDALEDEDEGDHDA